MLPGSEYTNVLDMSGFWIYQGHEYASVLNKAGVWISQGSEYNMVLKTRLVLNLPGFWIRVWFWICLNMPDYVWLNVPGYMSEYVGICLNMPKSALMAFVLYFPIVILCLLEGLLTYFNVYTKLEVLVWMKTRLLS